MTGTTRRLVRNAVRCCGCGDVIESKHRHDFKSCSCRATFIDGGLDYNRVGFSPVGHENMCEYEEVTQERLDQEALGAEIAWEYYGGKERARERNMQLLAQYYAMELDK